MKPFAQVFVGILSLAVPFNFQAAVPPLSDGVTLQSTDAIGPSLGIARHPDHIELVWPATLEVKGKGRVRPKYQIERSHDLVRWEFVGEAIDPENAAPLIRRARLQPAEQSAFYRVVARAFVSADDAERAALASGGAEVFGYGAAFARELDALGQITADQFAALYPPAADYVTEISYDPTSARYWPEFNIPPVQYNPWVLPLPHERLFDFRLDERELAVFQRNGFVVSERLATHSFAEMFYRVWMSDLPVFISTDAILQAWHRSYDMMLEEMEETYLFESIHQILDSMAGKVAAVVALDGNGVLRDSLADADYLLTVARSLLAGSPTGSVLDQEGRVQATLNAIQTEVLDECFPLFGRPRGVDFSQFKVRGHYENSERLGRYFKCVMWLGRTDLRVAGKNFQDSACDEGRDTDPRELGTALVLTWLLQESGQFERWLQMDRVIQAFVGWTDSMTFAQLSDVLASASVRSPADVRDPAVLLELQQAIEGGQYGAQEIRGDFFIAPLGPGQRKLPRSFTIFGQKFVPDSWVLSKVVFDDILWAENGQLGKVMRRVPSCLDVAFAVLGNDQIVPDLLQRIADTSATRNNLQRDGWPYQHNLAALRRVMDSQPWPIWESNIYMDWLATLRTLSRPITSDLRYPEVFRTRAWAMKTLNTQMASWTQLRHDTILYAKQSYTAGALCSHPDGYVEPAPAFWSRLRRMAERTAKLLGTLSLQGTANVSMRQNEGFWGFTPTVQVDLAAIQQAQITFLLHFAQVVARLERLALRELAGQPLSPDDFSFINSLIEHHPAGYNDNSRQFNGWYPGLFYRPSIAGGHFFHQDYGADKMDGLIVDVHTDVPCGDCQPSDVGSVLHEAVGNVNLLMIAAQRGAETLIFAGPVLSHYEFEFIGPPTRWADSQWKAALGWWQAGNPPPIPQTRPAWRNVTFRKVPPPPPWTQTYLVPAPEQ